MSRVQKSVSGVWLSSTKGIQSLMMCSLYATSEHVSEWSLTSVYKGITSLTYLQHENTLHLVYGAKCIEIWNYDIGRRNGLPKLILDPCGRLRQNLRQRQRREDGLCKFVVWVWFVQPRNWNVNSRLVGFTTQQVVCSSTKWNVVSWFEGGMRNASTYKKYFLSLQESFSWWKWLGKCFLVTI